MKLVLSSNTRSVLHRTQQIWSSMTFLFSAMAVVISFAFLDGRTQWSNQLVSQGIVFSLIGVFIILRAIPLIPIPGAAVEFFTLLLTQYSLGVSYLETRWFSGHLVLLRTRPRVSRVPSSSVQCSLLGSRLARNAGCVSGHALISSCSHRSVQATLLASRISMACSAIFLQESSFVLMHTSTLLNDLYCIDIRDHRCTFSVTVNALEAILWLMCLVTFLNTLVP